MMWSTVATSASAWLLGSLIVGALWPRGHSRREDAAIIVSLGLGLGLGVTSVCFFVASMVSAAPARLCAGLEVLVGATAAGGWCWRRRRESTGPTRVAATRPGWRDILLGSLFAQAALVALVAADRAYRAQPYSDSDGWTIWNMHARFLFRGGADWPALLHRPQLAWTHPDYPLLLPASVARAWAYAGDDAARVAGIVSTLFGIATVGLLVSAVSRLRHRHVATVGGLLLLGTPFFVTFSSNQHADIPLGFFMLAALVVIALQRRDGSGWGGWILAGGAAAMAAWTKNEGLLYAIVAGVGVTALETARHSPRNAIAFLVGLGLGLVPVVYFKLALAPANDLLASHPLSRWPLVFEWPRHRLILASLWRDAGRFGEWALVPFAAMVLPLLGSGWRRLHLREWLAGAVVLMMLAGYYAVYLLTHWELTAHVDSSLVRLLLQLWPAAVFFWCLAVTCAPPAAAIEADAQQPRPTARRFAFSGRRRAAMVVGANLVVAGVVLAALDRQFAANQLAATHHGDARIDVLLGEGWFGRERLGGDVWAWSRGRSTLLLRVDSNADVTAALKFSLRGLGARTATASMGDRVLWRGAVREEVDHVEIAGLKLPPGVTTLVFDTDSAGVPESTVPGARALTYALYNPQLH